MSRQQGNSDAAWIRSCVEDFVSRSPENTLGFEEPEPAFDRPLVGFAAGDDPLWQEFRRHIGDFHLTPADIFQTGFPEAPLPPAELTERAMNRYLKATYGIDNYACGLCQCGVPCTDHVPGPGEG